MTDQIILEANVKSPVFSAGDKQVNEIFVQLWFIRSASVENTWKVERKCYNILSACLIYNGWHESFLAGFDFTFDVI